ncbi:MAG TPA: hypothetical protein VMZ31_18680 [Phycisphaerae bacterium]|nr:hypothetical protein [Phycisphaerae bacterium]
MNCQEFAKFVYAEPLRERSSAAMQRLNDHAARCPSCARRLAAASHVEQSLAGLGHVRPPTNMLHNVMTQANAAKSAAPAAGKRFGDAVGWAAGLVGMMSLAGAYLLATPPTSWLERLSFRWTRPIGSVNEILGPLASDVTLVALLATVGALLVIAGFAARSRGA